MTRPWMLLLPLALVAATSVHAETEMAPTAPAEREPRRFSRGSQEWSLSFAQGSGLGIWGSADRDTEEVELTGLVPRFGVGLTDPVGADTWYHGNLELLVEGALLVAYAPKGGFLGGAGLALRYNFLGWERFVPFVELGGGLAGLELDLEDQSDGLGFTAHGGLGLHGWLSERIAFTASWRLHHVSNAGIGADNTGINDSMFLVGLSYFP
jgi:hypothetical protein